MEKFPTEGVVKHWKRLLKEAVESSPLEVFNKQEMRRFVTRFRGRGVVRLKVGLDDDLGGILHP